MEPDKYANESNNGELEKPIKNTPQKLGAMERI